MSQNNNRVRVPRGYWNIKTTQKYCNDIDCGYQVLDVKWVEKTYQKQFWVNIKCPNDNHSSYWVWWNNFLSGYYCKECYYENNSLIKWDKEKAYNFVKEQGFEMLNKNDYKDVDSSFPCYDKDKFIYMISITNLRSYMRGQQKFSWFKNNPYAIYNVNNFCKLYRSEYECISTDYLGVKATYLFKYNGDFNKGTNDERVFEATIDGFVHGKVDHPYLTQSKGEHQTELFLKNNNINYVYQKTYDDCKDKHKLPFDFYLPDYNLIIEIMGKQHIEPVEWFGGIKSLEYTQNHDNIKRDYLTNHNINLLEIWYYDFDNIENILAKELNLEVKEVS